jgi:hypothetical protein
MTIRTALVLLLAVIGPAAAFVSQSSRVAFGGVTSTSLCGGPFDKFINRAEYDKTVDNIAFSKGLTREEAEKDYDAYLENPTNYALQKGEEYYRSLGYKGVLDGVIGEAEKEGRGEEVRARVEAFQKKSKMKGLAVMGVAISSLLYYKITAEPFIPPSSM